MVVFKRVLFVGRPTGGNIDIAQTFQLDTATIHPDRIPSDHVIVKVTHLSLDPAMRGWMNDTRSYIPPVQIGEVMRAYGIGIVWHSTGRLSTGTVVSGLLNWQEYAVVKESALQTVHLPKNAPPTLALSLLSMTGLTAYFGLLDVGKPKQGDTIVISGAAGATGSTAGQIAKILGCRVIGIAGSADKCAWLKNSLHFDEALNYNDPDFPRQLKQMTPKYIDIYFDNVGGEILDLCLARLAEKGRVVLCGAISQYNAKQPKGPANYMTLITMRGRMQGFIVTDYQEQFPRAIAQMSQWYAEGKLQARDTIIQGLENAPQGLVDLFNGKNTGKMIVQVVTPDQAKL